MRGKSLLFLSAMVALGTPGAQAQYAAKDWPDGTSKQRFVDTCNGCHDINRVRIGYTPEGWLTVVRMMQNMQAPVPAQEWGPLTDYLMQSFPERKRPEAAIIDGPVKVDIRMWDVPTQGARPHDPLRTIRSLPGMAQSGGPPNWPTSLAGSIRRPAPSGNIR